MDHNVIAFAPIRFVVKAHAMLTGAKPFHQNVPRNIGAGADAFGQKLFLRGVVMAAPPGNEQGVNRLRGAEGSGERQEKNREDDTRRQKGIHVCEGILRP